MRVLALIVGWLFGLLFLILAVAALFYSVATAVPLLLAAILLLPPVRHRVHLITKRTLPRKARLISLAILSMMALILLGSEISHREDEVTAIELQARIAKYREQKPTILDSISTAISRSDFEIAISQIDRYAFAEDTALVALKHLATEKQQEKLRNERRDQILAELRRVPASEFARKKQLYGELLDLYPDNPTYVALKRLATEKQQEKLRNESRDQILAELRRVPASEFARNKQLYGELLDLYPDNPTYRTKVDDYSARLSQKQERERLAAERTAREARQRAARKERIESQFSAWDGAHRNLTRVIKESMNDPDSYKHDETVYWDMGDHLVVRTTFRGKNAFGGVVRNWVKAKVDLDGTVIAILEQGP